MAPEGFWRREISGDASLGTSGGGTISEGRTRPRGNVGMSSAWPCGNPPGGLQGIWDFPGTSQCCVWKSWREKGGVLHCHGARGGDGWGARDPSGIRIQQEAGSNRTQNPAGIRIKQNSESSRNQDPGFVTREKPSMGMELQESPVGLSHSSGKGLRRIWAPLAPPPAWISLDPWKFPAHGPG